MSNDAVGSRAAAAKVLVTGGSGFIGRNVVAALRAVGLPVRVVDLVPHPDPDVEIVLGDLARAEVIDASLAGGIDAIVHLAAVTSVLRSVEQPALTYRTNVAATAALLEAAREADVRALVFASTNAVVGPMQGASITESDLPQPLTPYGATKAAGEMLMSAYTSSYGLRCACLRLTNVYGLGMALKDSIIARLMRAIRTGSTFEVYGDGRQVRDYVNVADVTAAIQLALGDERWHGPVVIGSGTSRSVLEVVEAVREVTGAVIDVTNGPARAGEMPAVVVDNAVARSRGWSPRYTLAGGLAGVWEEWSGADMSAAPPHGPAAQAGGAR